MSTKIYDAYKFNKKYSLDELMSIFDTWRKDINDMAEKDFANVCLHKFTTYYDLLTLKGIDYIKEQKEKLNPKDKYDKNLIGIYDALERFNNNEISITTVMMYIVDMYRYIITSNENDFRYFNQRFKSTIQVFTVARKIIFMYFGGVDYQKYIINQPQVEDYHYQNQTDKPDDISDDSWERRALNWDSAIGPDYIPINHGFTVQFINPDNIEFSVFNKYIKASNMSNNSFPTLEERTNKMLEYFNDYPNPPKKDASYSEIMAYKRTDEYNNWKEQKKKYIMKHLNSNLYELYKEKCKEII